MKTKNLDVLMVIERFEESVRTMRRLQIPHLVPMGYFSTWPPIIRTVWEQMLGETLPMRLGPPSPAAIDRMEETFDWICWLDEEERKIIWLRAAKVRWKVICWQTGYGKTKARDIWRKALCKIVDKSKHINSEKKNV